MKKTLVGLLLAVCLIVGLLPVTALADTPTTAKIFILSTYEMAVTEGGTPAYLKNKEFDAYNKEDGSSTFKAWTQEAGTSDNWNVKFEWPTGGTPTVTLKDAKLDYYDNETETYAYLKQADGSYISTANRTSGDLVTNGETAENMLVSAIFPAPDCPIDLKVVLQGENLVETGSGFVFGNVEAKANLDEQLSKKYQNYYFKNLTFTSIDGGKVVVDGSGIGIMTKPGYNITFDNAFVEISTTVMGSNACPIHATKGDITINGGHIKATNPNNVAITAFSGGNIIINGDVTVSHTLTSTAAAAGISAHEGTITINGGNIVGTSTNAPILRGGKGITVNGGNLKLSSLYYAIYADPGIPVRFNGGTTEIEAKNAFKITPIMGDKVTAIMGANAENAEIFDGTNHLKPWALITDDASKLPTTTLTEPLIPQPTTAPTQAPTQSTASTDATNTDDQSTTDNRSTILLIVAAAVIAIAGVVTVLIIIKRKKA